MDADEMFKWLRIHEYESAAIKRAIVRNTEATWKILLAEELRRTATTGEQINAEDLIEKSIRLGSTLTARLVEKKIL